MKRAKVDPIERLASWVEHLEHVKEDYGGQWQGDDFLILSGRNVPRRPVMANVVTDLIKAVKAVEKRHPEFGFFDISRLSIRKGDFLGQWLLRCVEEVSVWAGLPSVDESPAASSPPREPPSDPRAGGADDDGIVWLQAPGQDGFFFGDAGEPS